MISETLARRLWPGQRAVGRRLMIDYSTAGTYPSEIVGVVKDVRFRGPRSEPLAEVYIPHAQRSYLILNVTLRSTQDPRTLIPAVRQVLKEIDPHKPAHGVYPLEDLVGATIARDRQAMLTLVLFAAAAVCLAVMSVYGVLSQRVRERSREIGIRDGDGRRPVAGRGLGDGAGTADDRRRARSRARLRVGADGDLGGFALRRHSNRRRDARGGRSRFC